MAICVFFGHSLGFYTPHYSKLKGLLTMLIEQRNVDCFYLGHRGNFDKFCKDVVFELRASYSHIQVYRVLAYRPKANDINWCEYGYDGSIYLLEKSVPYRFAILETNRALVEKADFIISGVYAASGGAFKATQYAQKINKNIINLFS